MAANPSALVYGTITIGALLAAESTTRETYSATVGAVILAMIIYWLAYSYSDLTGQRLARRERLEAAGLARALLHEVPVLAGAGVPLTALLICWAIGVTLYDAVSVSIWTSAAMIVVIEVTAGVRADLSGRELAAQTSLGAVLGLGVIAMRVLLH